MVGRQFCIVGNCNRICPAEPGISFHRIPSGKAQEKWFEFIKTNNRTYQRRWTIMKTSKLCSRHFTDSSFEQYGKFRMIKPGCFPTIFVDTSGNRVYENDHMHQESQPVPEPMEVDSNDDQPSVQIVSAVPKQRLSRRNKYSPALSIRDLDHQRKILQHVITFKNRMIRVLRQKLIRTELKSPRKSEPSVRSIGIQTTQPQEINDHHEDRQKFLKIRNSLTSRLQMPKTSEFDASSKEFALKLHYYSPKAYDFLRSKFQFPLPYPNSLLGWTKSIDTRPGLLKASLDFVRRRNQESPYKLHYCISLDEMAIRKQILYDAYKMKGYIDYGDFVKPTKADDPAKNALFIMCNEVNGTYRTPVAYVLTAKLDSDLIACIIKRILVELHSCQAKPVSITFDGLKTNYLAGKKLGANFDVTSPDLKTYMTHPCTPEKVYFTPDPCHIMKLFRNMFQAYGCLEDVDKQEIRWEYFTKLTELQTKEGLRAANKLTPSHVDFGKQKMKVKLAVQLMSSSVGAALNMCEKIGIPEFQGSEATSRFVKLADRIFDSLNSFPRRTGYKAPLSAENKDKWKPLFKEVKTYMLGLKRKSDGRKIVNSKRSACVTGLIVCLTSFEAIMDTLVLPGLTSLKYLSTYKFSQDILELYFSALRQRFGNNNNPNRLQLEHALRRMLPVSIDPNIRGNCLPQDSTQTARVSALSNVAASPQTSDETDIPEFSSFSALSSFVDNIVVYIAGYVGRNVVKKLDCELCISALLNFDIESTDLRSDYILINTKNNGGLFIPSADLVSACRVTEQVLRSAKARGVESMNKDSIMKTSIQQIVSDELFNSLRLSFYKDHKQFGTHVIDLIKLIVSQYTKIRLHYIAKEKTQQINPTSIRNQMTKLVTFNHQ